MATQTESSSDDSKKNVPSAKFGEDRVLIDSPPTPSTSSRQLPTSEDAAALARRSILDEIESQALYKKVDTLVELWPRGRWSYCRDDQLILEAFEALKKAWKHLQGSPCDQEHRQVHEEQLTRLFHELQVWRLPEQSLLSPWVPGHVLLGHISSQCAQLETNRATLVEEARQSAEELKQLLSAIDDIKKRAEVANARTQHCMQRQADVNEQVRYL